MSERLVNIGEVIVQGVAFDPKNGERLRAMDLNELFDSVPKLFDLLDQRGIDYVLVGGIAMLAYVDGRNTQDIDLIVARDDLERLQEIKIEEDNPDFARGWLGDLRVDFLFTRNKLFKLVQNNYAVTQEFIGRQIPCATHAGLVMLKLFALPSLYRQGRFDRVRIYQNDVADLIEKFNPPIEPIFQELAKHLMPSDMDELRSIVQKIEADIADSRQRFRGDA